MQFDSLDHREIVLKMLSVCNFTGERVQAAAKELHMSAALADCGRSPEEIAINRDKIFQPAIQVNGGNGGESDN